MSIATISKGLTVSLRLQSDKELTVIKKLTNRLVPHDDEVNNANTKPNFQQLFYQD